MKKIIKRLFKTLGYLFLYLIVTLATAVGVIFVSQRKPEPTSPNEVIASQVSSMFSKLTNSPAIDINLDAVVETDEKNFDINVSASINLENGFDKLEASGTIQVNIGEKPLVIDFTFKDNVIYLELLGAKLRIETDELVPSISKIMGLLGVQMPDLGLDLDSLDTNSILAMLSDLVETSDENNIYLEIKVPVIGTLTIVCDKEYSIQSIKLPKTTILDGTAIALDADMNYPEKVEVETPNAQEFTQASYILDVADVLIEYVKSNQIGLNLNVNSSKLNLNGVLSADIQKSMASFEMDDLLGQRLKLMVMDGSAFVEFGNLNLKYNLNELPTALELINNKLKLDLPVDTISDLLLSAKGGNLTEMLSSIDLSSLGGMDDLDLSFLDKFEKTETGYFVSIKDLASIEFAVSEGKFEGITATIDGTTISATKTTPNPIKLATDKANYIDVADLLPALSAGIESYNSGRLSGSGTLTFGQYNFPIEFKMTLTAPVRLNAVINLFGQDVVADLEDGELFLTFKGIKFRGKLTDFASLTDIVDKLGIDSTGLVLPESLSDIINPQVYSTLIGNLVSGANSLSLKLLNQIDITLKFDDVITQVGVSLGDTFKAELNLDKSDAALTFDQIDKTEYQSASDLLAKLPSLIEYVKNKEFYLHFIASYSDLKLEGAINYANKQLIASAVTEIKGVTLNLIYQNKVVYLKVGNFNLKLELSEVNTLVEFLKTEFDIDISDKVNPILNLFDGASTSLGDLNIENLLGKLSVSLSGNTLAVQLDDIFATITLSDENITKTGIHIEAKGIVADASIKSSAADINLESEYFDVTQILPFISSFKSYLAGKQYNLTANAHVNDKDDNGNKFETYKAEGINLQIDLSSTLRFYANASVLGTHETTSGTAVNLQAILGNEYMFVDYNGLAVKMRNTDLEQLLKIVCNLLGINETMFNEIVKFANNQPVDLKAMLGSISNTNLLENPSYIINMFTKFAVVDENTLSISLDGSAVTSDQRALSMEIDIIKEGNTLKMIRLKNMYTGVTTSEHFDLDVYFNEFDSDTFESLVSAPADDQRYKDISGANDLVDALANTAKILTTFDDTRNYNTVQVKGNLTIDLPLLSDWIIPIDLQIKLLKVVDENQQTSYDTEIYAAVGPIPVSALNNSTPWSNTDILFNKITDRMLYIYYKDKNIYLYRTETHSNEKYEKALKVSLETFMSDDILYYLQWATGLGENIINLISKDMDKNKDNKPDLASTLTHFKTPNTDGNNTDNYELKLNLGALTGNSNLQDLTIGIGIADHGGKNVLSNATLQLSMVKNLIKITSTDLTATLDAPLSEMNQNYYSFIESFKELNGQDSTEYENYAKLASSDPVTYNDNWKRAERKFTITFVSDYGSLNPAAVTAERDSTFTLQDFENITLNQTEYYFDGWFTDPSFGEEFRFSQKGETEATVPHRNITLYAKWIIKNAWRTINYYDYYKQLVTSETYQVIVDFVMQDIELLTGGVPENLEIEREDGAYLDLIKFVYWANEGNRFVKVPLENIDLYATYEVQDTLFRRNLDVYAGKGGNNQNTTHSVYSSRSFQELLPAFVVGNDYELSVDGIKHIYKFMGWFLDSMGETPLTSYIMPNEDICAYAIWSEVTPVTPEYQLTVYDGEIKYETFVEEGAALDFENLKFTAENETSCALRYFAESSKFYTTATFDEGTEVQILQMPGAAWTLYIRNKYQITYDYYRPAEGTAPEHITGVMFELYQGETFSLQTFENYEHDVLEGELKLYRIGYRFDGYDLNFVNPLTSLDGNGSISAQEAQNAVVVGNYDMNFTFKLSTPTLDYIKVKFVGEWTDTSYGTDTNDTRTKEEYLYLLDTSYIQGMQIFERNSVLNETYNEAKTTPMFETEVSHKQLGFGIKKDYKFQTFGWNTSEVKNLYSTWGGNVNANGEKMTVSAQNNTFYSEWGYVK